MPVRHGTQRWLRDLPLKVLIGRFSQSKRWDLESRYRRKGYRVQFRAR